MQDTNLRDRHRYMINKLIRKIIKLLPDDTLCLLEDEFFKEMERRKFIIYEDDLNQSVNN